MDKRNDNLKKLKNKKWQKLIFLPNLGCYTQGFVLI